MQADSAVTLCVFLEQLPTALVLPVIQRCVALIPSAVESVKVFGLILMERILVKYQNRREESGVRGSRENGDRCERAGERSASFHGVLSGYQAPHQTNRPLRDPAFPSHRSLPQRPRFFSFSPSPLQILPYCTTILYRLVNLLSYISNVVPNPYFIHYLFESLVAFVRISRSQADLCANIEQYLTPYLREVPVSTFLLF